MSYNSVDKIRKQLERRVRSENKKESGEVEKKKESGEMKMRLSIMVLACVAALSAKATVIFTNNFESYTSGNLNGQGGWSAGGSIQVTQGVGFNTTKVVGNGTNDNTATKAITLTWGANTKGSFSFDTYFGGTTGNVGYVGIGKGTTSYLGFYLSGTTLQYRPGPSAGTMTAMVNGSGTQTALATGKWYNVTANFTLADNTITDVWLTDLTGGGAAVQQYFGAGNATRIYTEAGDEAGWNTAILRVAPNTGSVRMIDNMQVSAIPLEAELGLDSAGRPMLKVDGSPAPLVTGLAWYNVDPAPAVCAFRDSGVNTITVFANLGLYSSVLGCVAPLEHMRPFWTGPAQYDDSDVNKILAEVVTNHPNSKIMVWLVTCPRVWIQFLS